MILGFSGTRQGMTKEQQRFVVDALAGATEHVEFHHGCCRGSDEEAHWLAFELGCSIVGHPPVKTDLMMDVEGFRDSFLRLEAPQPYLVRDRAIVDVCDALIGCPAWGPRQGGTWYTVNYARLQGKPGRVVMPSGRVERLPVRKNGD